jgi:hypothetical protein
MIELSHPSPNIYRARGRLLFPYTDVFLRPGISIAAGDRRIVSRKRRMFGSILVSRLHNLESRSALLVRGIKS